MTIRKRWLIEGDDSGRLVLPPEVVARLGLAPGARLALEAEGDYIFIERSVHQLARLNVEPTNACNLECATCMRNVWDEPLGMMSPAVFERVLEGLAQFSPRPLVFFGGYGEPLSHPDIIPMVLQCKAAGCAVEVITNGTLLDETLARGLLQAGLDGLWVSIDGATPQSYADVRLGDCLPQVLTHLQRFSTLRSAVGRADCQLGIAFVIMRRNLHDLPGVIRMGIEMGVTRFSVSNVLAHTPQLRDEVLYKQAIYDTRNQFPKLQVQVNLPRLDLDEDTRRMFGALLGEGLGINPSILSNLSPNRCPFISNNSASVRWDGSLSPCLALLHAHTSFLGEHPRHSQVYLVGNLLERSLEELWNAADYRALREKLLEFDFSPCVYCNTCEMSEHNLEDCFGNTLPTCGGCLWAQGLIRCP